MSTVTSEIPTSTQVTTSADRLRHQFSAMRLSFTWLGTRKSLSTDQRQQAASQFGAEEKFISAGKKLLDSGHPALRTVNQIRRQIVDYWKGMSLPYPEPGIRLVRHDDLEQLAEMMDGRRQQLQVAVRELEIYYSEIKEQAAERLGSAWGAPGEPVLRIGLSAELHWAVRRSMGLSQCRTT